ncbi:MAG: hypothetical protein P8O08_10865 [Paracoccaceae bacterium]|nr:hypothetical protein [Paracoccaceae bacterium]
MGWSIGKAAIENIVAVHVQPADTAESIRPYLEAMRVTALDVLNLGRQIVMQ